jgi:cobalt-zinc-cadmium resistance protein CzcA
VQQPLACVIVGGMLLSPICSLLVIPAFARLAMRGAAPVGAVAPAPAT